MAEKPVRKSSGAAPSPSAASGAAFSMAQIRGRLRANTATTPTGGAGAPVAATPRGSGAKPAAKVISGKRPTSASQLHQTVAAASGNAITSPGHGRQSSPDAADLDQEEGLLSPQTTEELIAEVSDPWNSPAPITGTASAGKNNSSNSRHSMNGTVTSPAKASRSRSTSCSCSSCRRSTRSS